MIPAAELLRSLRSASDRTVWNFSPTLWSGVAVEDPCTYKFLFNPRHEINSVFFKTVEMRGVCLERFVC